MSEGRWRQIIKGYNQVSRDTFVATVAPAETLARMARVVGATPEQLKEAGREDAAVELVGIMPISEYNRYIKNGGTIEASRSLGRGLASLIPTRPATDGTDTGIGYDSAFAKVSHAAITPEQAEELQSVSMQIQTAIILLTTAQEDNGRAVLVGARNTIDTVIRQLYETKRKTNVARHPHLNRNDPPPALDDENVAAQRGEKASDHDYADFVDGDLAGRDVTHPDSPRSKDQSKH